VAGRSTALNFLFASAISLRMPIHPNNRSVFDGHFKGFFPNPLH
jgi:hypothetical protein